MKTALLIIDIQNDFVTGSLATDPTQSFTLETSVWLAEHAAEYDAIATTQDWHVAPEQHFETWPIHCVANTEGAALHSYISAALTNLPVTYFLKGQYSDGYSGFDGVDAYDEDIALQQWLEARDIEQVDIIGIATDHCVRATAMDAIKHGMKVRVLAPYVQGVDPDASQHLLDVGFQQHGIEVVHDV